MKHTIATTQIPFEEIQYSVGAWALPYLVNGDISGLEDEEQLQIDEWVDTVTQSWRDADDNLWVFAYEAIDADKYGDQFDEFGVDDITGLRGPVYRVTLVFRRSER
jgi:hypothetical protein